MDFGIRLTAMLYRSLMFVIAALAAAPATGNDLVNLYRLALSHDATLQAATSQRDAAVEAKPQALAGLLPQLAAQASANRERAGFQTGAIETAPVGSGPILSSVAQNCVLSDNGQTEQ